MIEERSPTLLPILSNRQTFGQSGTRASTILSRKQQIFGDEIKDSQIRFKSKPGELYNLINRDLKLRNQSDSHIIKFFIQCNNPLHYRVHPATGDIPPGKTIEIIIQINGMQEVSELGRSFFAKFASDRFQITWYYYKQENKYHEQNISKIRTNYHSKILTVFVEYNEEKVSELEVGKKEPAEIQTQVLETLEANRKQLAKIQSLITLEEKKHIDSSWINTKLLAFFSILAFIIGALIPF